MGETYGRMPHEIARGVLDPRGVRLRPAWFRFDLQCTHALNTLRAKAEANARRDANRGSF